MSASIFSSFEINQESTTVGQIVEPMTSVAQSTISVAQSVQSVAQSALSVQSVAQSTNIQSFAAGTSSSVNNTWYSMESGVEETQSLGQAGNSITIKTSTFSTVKATSAAVNSPAVSATTSKSAQSIETTASSSSNSLSNFGGYFLGYWILNLVNK